MSSSDSPSKNDTDWFTDADQLKPPSDFVRPEVSDPDRPPPAGASAGGAGQLTGETAALAAVVRSALGSDEAGVHAFDRLTKSRLAASAPLFQNLASLATTGRDPRFALEGIDPWLILSQVVRALDNPLRVKQGSGRGTCGAGTLEYMLLRRHPAELVRLVDGLTRHGGEIDMRSGATLTLPSTAVPRDDSGRVDIYRLFQSSIMNRATAMSWIFDYDNENDEDTFLSAMQGDSRMPLSGFTRVWAELTGEELDAKSSMLFGREELANEVATALGKGGLVAVIMTWSSDTSFHFLCAEKSERGPGGEPSKVYMRNPRGDDAGTGRPTRTALPGGGGRISMAFPDFASVIAGAAVRG
jgi:hypothetical protein